MHPAQQFRKLIHKFTYKFYFLIYSISWEQRKFSDITFPAGEKNKDNLPLESYSITNEHGFVPQDEKFENGGTMREADKRMYYIVSPNSFAYNPARINVGSIGYQNIGKNVIVSSLYEVFKTSEDVDDRLLWHWFKSPDFQKLIMQLQEGGVRLYFYYDKLCMGEVSLPSLEEQRKIGKLFDTLDNLITLHQRKLEKLKNIKKSMLEKMFPRDGSKFPEIRFSGFTDPWEQRKLGEVGKARSGIGFPDAEQGGTEGIPFFKVSDMNLDGNGNEMNHANNYVSAEQIAARRWAPITEVPAVFFAKVGAAVMLNRKRLCRFPFLLDNNTMAYSLDQNVWDADFAKALFETVDLTSLVQVGALPSYNAGDVEAMEIMLPTMAEQEKIGLFFARVDNLITLHQRKYDKLLSIKKSMLEKMFPRDGSKFPEIRFSGFTNPWEQRKLGEVGKARSGIGFPDAEQGGTEGIPFFKVSDMNLDGNGNEMNHANNYVSAEQIAARRWAPITEVPAVFFAKVGAAVMLNRKRLCRFPFLLDNNTMAYSLDQNVWDADFAKALFETVDLTSLVQVGALPSYNAGDVEAMEIMLPTMAEQEKIGLFFARVDNLITLHQRKLEKLKNIKKSMLEKMFV